MGRDEALRYGSALQTRAIAPFSARRVKRSSAPRRGPGVRGKLLIIRAVRRLGRDYSLINAAGFTDTPRSDLENRRGRTRMRAEANGVQPSCDLSRSVYRFGRRIRRDLGPAARDRASPVIVSCGRGVNARPRRGCRAGARTRAPMADRRPGDPSGRGIDVGRAAPAPGACSRA